MALLQESGGIPTSLATQVIFKTIQRLLPLILSPCLSPKEREGLEMYTGCSQGAAERFAACFSKTVARGNRT